MEIAAHARLIRTITSTRSTAVPLGGVGTPAGPSGIHLVATLTFDSMAALQAGLGSPEGAAAGGDVANFATGGADLLMFEDAPA